MVEPGILSTLGSEPSIENRDVTRFVTLPPFQFLGVQCKDLAGTEIVIRPDAAAANQPRCNPASPVSLIFSSPVRESELSKTIRILPASKGGETGEEGMWPESDYSISMNIKKRQPYSAELENDSLRPFSEYRIRAKANGVKDEFGRLLPKAIDMRFATDHLPPELHLFKNMSVLEKGLDTDLPALATNIDQVEMEYEILTAGWKPTVRKGNPARPQRSRYGPGDAAPHPQTHRRAFGTDHGEHFHAGPRFRTRNTGTGGFLRR